MLTGGDERKPCVQEPGAQDEQQMQASTACARCRTSSRATFDVLSRTHVERQ